MKKISIIGITALSFLAVSCNKDYDFSKLDTKMAIGKGLEIPVVDSIQVRVSKLIKLSAESKLVVDKDSNYVFAMKTSPRTTTFDIGAIKVPATSLDTKGIKFWGPTSIPAEDITINAKSDDNKLDVSCNDLPGLLTDLGKMLAETSSQFKLSLQLPSIPNVSALTLKNNEFEIKYPEWIEIASCADPHFSVIPEESKVKLTGGDYRVLSGEKLTLDMVIAGIDCQKFDGVTAKFTPGTQKANDGKIEIHTTVSIGGTMIIKKEDVTGTAPLQEYSIGINSSITDINVTDAMVKANPDLSELKLDPFTFKEGDFPEFLTKEGTIIDMAGSFNVGIAVANPSPFAIELNTKLISKAKITSEPYTEEQETMLFGQYFGEDRIIVPADRTDTVVVSRMIKDTESGKSLFYRVPYELHTSDYSIGVIQDKWSHVQPGTSFQIDFTVIFTAPFVVDKDLLVLYDNYQLKDFSFELEENTQLPHTTLTAVAVNTVPFAAAVTGARALDKDNKELPDIVVTVKVKTESGNITAGSPTNPSRSDMEVILESDASLSKVKSFSLDFLLLDGNKSACLNGKQTISLENAHIHLDSGLEINPKK